MFALLSMSSLRTQENDSENKGVSPKPIPCHKDDLHKAQISFKIPRCI